MMRKEDKMKRLCAASLTYFRLKADLAAIELELADNAPLLQTTEGNFLKKIWKKATTGIHNELRKKTTETLEKERAVVERELAKFESQHTEKTLLYSNNPEALKAFINKSLFRKDKDGLKRLRFAISLILDDRYSYQRPILSLQPLSDILFDDAIYMQSLYDTLDENFKYVRRDFSLSLDELISFIPSLGNVSLQCLINRSQQREFTKNLGKLSADQVGTLLAIKLTIAEKAKPLLTDEAWKELIDETLQFIGDIRADEEYKKVFTEQDALVSDEVFSLCSLSVNRLAELVKG